MPPLLASKAGAASENLLLFDACQNNLLEVHSAHKRHIAICQRFQAATNVFQALSAALLQRLN